MTSISSPINSQDSQNSTVNKKLHSKEKPFLIELWETDRQPGGAFTPAAAMHLTSTLRTSGLLRELSPDDLKSLVYLLTFVSPEGHCQPFLSQLSEEMRLSPSKTKARMRRLCDIRWKGEPLAVYTHSASGLTAFSLNPRIVTYQHRKPLTEASRNTFRAASRDQVIAHSRKHYARPRAEVERMIARQMGEDVDETDAERKVRFRLENNGLSKEQAKETLATFDLDSIINQLDWLPFRHAKNPAGYLLAAIEGNYSEPRALKEERLFRELRFEGLQAENREEESEMDDDCREGSLEFDASGKNDFDGDDGAAMTTSHESEPGIHSATESQTKSRDETKLEPNESLDLPLPETPDNDAGQ